MSMQPVQYMLLFLVTGSKFYRVTSSYSSRQFLCVLDILSIVYMYYGVASDLIKGLASPSQDKRRQKGERGKEEEDGGVTGAQRKQAWGEESMESPRLVGVLTLVNVVSHFMSI